MMPVGCFVDSVDNSARPVRLRQVIQFTHIRCTGFSTKQRFEIPRDYPETAELPTLLLQLPMNLKRTVGGEMRKTSDPPPTACKEPPWAWLLKRLDAEQTAKVLRVLGKRPSK